MRHRREAGIVHTRATRSISSHVASRTSLVRATVSTHELERQLRPGPRRRGPDGGDRVGDLAIRQCRHVADPDDLLRPAARPLGCRCGTPGRWPTS